MAEVTVNLALVSGKVVDSQAPTSRTDFYNGSSDSHFRLKNYPSYGNISRAFAKYSSLSDSYKYKKLISAQLAFRSATNKFNVGAYALTQDIDLSAITWNNAPALPDEALGTAPTYLVANFLLPIRTNSLEPMSAAELSNAGKALLNAKTIALATVESETYTTLYTEYEGANVHYLRVIVDPDVTITSQVEAVNSPTSGYVNPRVANSFSWNLVSSDSVYTCVGEFVQQSATFYWRKKGTTTWNQVSAGTAKTKSISANSFPTASTIQWYISATDTNGTTSNTPIYEFSTAAGAVTATPVSPADSVEDNSAEIEFKWAVTSADGQAHTSSELQYSTNGSSWTALASVSGKATSYVCPANTLPSGTLQWRVRARNIDGTDGAWSSPVSFVSFGAPQAPSVTVQAGGFAIVNWQADVQEAYRIIIDGKTIGPFFGTEKSFQFEDYISIGQHVVSVEVQNSFGLWSQPGSASFEVVTALYGAPQLNKRKQKPETDVNLIIHNENASIATGLFLYRDGEKIASLDPSIVDQTYTDRFVLGRNSYLLVAKYGETEASYSASPLNVTAEVCFPMIALFSGGEWLPLRLSVDADRVQSFTKARNVSLRHFSGSAYPVAEIGAAEDEIGSYDAAFRTPEELAQFEALFGKPVIMKTPGGQVLIGILSNVEKTFGEFCISATFSISRIHWRDYRDLSNS